MFVPSLWTVDWEPYALHSCNPYAYTTSALLPTRVSVYQTVLRALAAEKPVVEQFLLMCHVTALSQPPSLPHTPSLLPATQTGQGQESFKRQVSDQSEAESAHYSTELDGGRDAGKEDSYQYSSDTSLPQQDGGLQ